MAGFCPGHLDEHLKYTEHREQERNVFFRKNAVSYYILPKKGNERIGVSYLKNFKIIYFPSWNNKTYDFD